jgi:hypothetical protein
MGSLARRQTLLLRKKNKKYKTESRHPHLSVLIAPILRTLLPESMSFDPGAKKGSLNIHATDLHP